MKNDTDEKILCCRGCGKEATYTTWNGKHVCAKNQAYCPAIQLKRKTAYAERTEEQKAKTREKKKGTMIERHGVEHSLQSPILMAKRNQTCLERHGTIYPSQLEEFKEKSRQVCLDRYGVEYIGQVLEFQENRKQTWLEKYGAESIFQTDMFKEKRRLTWLDNYGVEHIGELKEFQELRKQICLERYGVEIPATLDIIKEKIIQTNLQRYGVKHFTNRQLAKETCLGKYGVENVGSVDEFQEKRVNTILEQNKLKYIDTNEVQRKENYYRNVTRITEQNWRKHSNKIIKNGITRGSDNDLDHIFSRHEGYLQNIPPEIIGHWTNLRIIHYSDNRRKKNDCHKSLDSLYEEYYKSIVIPIMVK